MYLQPTLPEPGTLIRNKYRIHQQLGVGGMGTVYLAVDETLGRQVAIKVLNPLLSRDEQSQSRFRYEAKMARRLTHPNTIQIFDFGELQSGLPFIVMEYLRGHNLEDMVKASGPMSLQRALHIGRQVLSSLAEAHYNNVIHRDLKPSNVIVGEYGTETDFAKVLDFGIAKLLDSDRDPMSLKTRTGLVVGSPAYMAPERLQSKTLHPRSDIFSFGIMLAEMLIGGSLYAGMAPMEILARHLTRDPIPIPTNLLVGPAGALLQRACAKDPERRYQSAEEVIAEIDAVMAQLGNSSSAARTGNPLDVVAKEPTTPMHSLEEHMSRQAPLGPPPMPSHSTPMMQAYRPTEPAAREPGVLANPINVVLVVLILLLLVGTAILVVAMMG